MHPGNHGLHSSAPVFSAATLKCGHSSTSASGSSENEVKSEMDGRTAGS